MDDNTIRLVAIPERTLVDLVLSALQAAGVRRDRGVYCDEDDALVHWCLTALASVERSEAAVIAEALGLGEPVCKDGLCSLCSVTLPAGWDSDFMKADQTYFEAHPEAPFYTRPIFPTEHPFICDEPTEYVAVFNIAPGTRLRQGRMFPTQGGTQ